MNPGRRRLLGALLAGGAIAAAPRARADGQSPPTFDLGAIPAAPYRNIGTAVYIGVAAAGPRLVCVGERGFVLLSDDDGLSWRQAEHVPVSVALTSVFFIDGQLGWATGHGGTVLATRDGGRNWSRVLDGRRAAAIELAAAAAEGDNASRLRNARQLVADGPDKPFLDVHFTDPEHGLVVGAYGLAFRTADGGRNWVSAIGDIDNPEGHHLYDIIPAPHARYISGEQGTLLRAPAGQEHYAAIDVGYKGTLFGGLASADGSMLVFGLRGNARRSADGADGWAPVAFGAPVTLTAGCELRDGRIAVVDESGRALISSDRGASFRSVDHIKMDAATGVCQSAGGALIVSTQRGSVRIAPQFLASTSKV